MTFDDIIKMEKADKQKDEMMNEPIKRQRSSLSISSIRILTEDEINRVKAKIYEDMESGYLEAIRAHKNIQDTKIPTYMWIALAWFASDNIAGWLTSPILFYPLIILAGVCVILHQLGVLTMMINIGLPSVKAKINVLLASCGVPFRIWAPRWLAMQEISHAEILDEEGEISFWTHLIVFIPILVQNYVYKS